MQDLSDCPLHLAAAATDAPASSRNVPSPRHRILVRFNTKWKEDPEQRTWRVLVNGQEKLADQVAIRIPALTIQEAINGETKFHFECFGRVRWNGSSAEVVSHMEDGLPSAEARPSDVR